MRVLTLHPMLGIDPFTLGSSREQIMSVAIQEGILKSYQRETVDYFYENAIQVEYVSDGTASFIGISSHPQLSLHYRGRDLFDIEAREAFQLLAESEPSRAHAFEKSEYLFPEQIVTLYEAGEQYDYKRGENRMIWGQIGIGNQAYLQAILKIHQKYKK